MGFGFRKASAILVVYNTITIQWDPSTKLGFWVGTRF